MKYAFAVLATLLVTAALAPAQKVRAFEMEGERSMTGLFYWDGKSSPGQIFVHYGAPPWQDKWEAAYVASKQAMSMRLGKDHWTTLDLGLACKIGGVEVPAGIYYLGLHKTADGAWKLMILDPVTVKKQKKNPSETPKLKAKIHANLTYRKVGKSSEKLNISIKPSKSDPLKGAMVIHWSNHLLRADFEAMPSGPKASEAGAKKKKKN